MGVSAGVTTWVFVVIISFIQPIGSLEHFMKLGYPPGNELMAPCWQLRKINQLNKSAGNGREYVRTPRRVFIQSRVPKKLMTLELFYLSHANSRMAIRVAPEIAGLISIFRKPMVSQTKSLEPIVQHGIHSRITPKETITKVVHPKHLEVSAKQIAETKAICCTIQK